MPTSDVVNFMPEKRRLEEEKTLNLIKLRNYKQLKRTKQEDIITFVVRSPKGEEAIISCILKRKVVGVLYVRKLKKLMDEAGVERGIIVANARYTAASKREAKKGRIELIPKHFPSFNIFEHELVPKHEIIPPGEVEDLLQKFHIRPNQLPRVKATDVAVVAIGAKRGDIVKITRDSPTAGEYVAYRLVV